MPGVVTVRLPDGSTKEFAAGTDGARAGRSPSASGWPRRPWPPPSTGTRSTSTRPAGRDRGGRGHRRQRRRPGHPAPLDRPRPGPGRARLWPGAQFAIGPVINDGFYYDFALPGGAHFSDDDLERIAATHAGDHGRGPALHPPRALHRRGPGPVRRSTVQAGDHRGGRTPATTRWTPPAEAGEAAAGHDLPQLADVHRPVPGTARAVDRTARPLRPHAGGRRLLAGRREAPAAAAHLRHGLGVGEGPGRPPAPAGGGRASGPPQARGRARPVLLPRRDRLRAGRLPPEGRDHPPADGGLLAPASRGGRLRVREHPAHHQGRAVRDLGAPRLVRRRACSRPWSSTGASSTT